MFKTSDNTTTDKVQADRVSAADPNQLDTNELERANQLIADAQEERDHWFEKAADLEEAGEAAEDRLIKQLESAQHLNLKVNELKAEVKRLTSERDCWVRIFEMADTALRLLDNSEARVVQLNGRIEDSEGCNCEEGW